MHIKIDKYKKKVKKYNIKTNSHTKRILTHKIEKYKKKVKKFNIKRNFQYTASSVKETRRGIYIHASQLLSLHIGARRMEHVIIRHMHPVKSGKSYFLSRDVIEVSNLVMQTITHPDQILSHKSDKYKRVKKKKFPYQTGIHGCNSKPCYGVIVVEKTTDNRLITAYPV